MNPALRKFRLPRLPPLPALPMLPQRPLPSNTNSKYENKPENLFGPPKKKRKKLLNWKKFFPGQKLDRFIFAAASKCLMR